MLPEDKKDAVEKALQTAFGVKAVEDIRRIMSGLSSALTFRIVVNGKPYMMRITTRSGTATWYTSMSQAAIEKIAPPVYYLNSENGISITGFIESKPLTLTDAKIKIPALISRLHALPPFPFRVNYLNTIDNFIKQFLSLKLIPPSLTNIIFHAYNRIRDIYPYHKEDLVASHNDLKPENILFDGKRVWFVDWEASFLNDRYFDLAVSANFLIRNEDDEYRHLYYYFGKQATSYQRARFFLMQQLLHTSYFVTFIIFGNTSGEPINIDSPKPGFNKFHDDIWFGKISLADMENRITYALVHMQQLTENINNERFEKSIEIVANHLV